MVTKKYGTNRYYRFLIDSSGVTQQPSQTVGENPYYDRHGIGQSKFSPNGNLYVTSSAVFFDQPAHIDVLDFDRCSGMFTSFDRIEVEASGSPLACVISPNSRFLYTTISTDFIQFDLTSNNFDTTHLQTFTDFNGSSGQLGPDGKIYFAAGGTVNYMHVIHDPDSLGVSCNLEQAGLTLPTKNRFTIPHHPNYRLGRLIGSPCDTIYNMVSTTETPPELPQLELAPNPARQTVRLTNLPARVELRITNAQGQRVYTQTTSSYEAQLDVSDWIPGVYWVEVVGRKPERLVVVR